MLVLIQIVSISLFTNVTVLVPVNPTSLGRLFSLHGRVVGPESVGWRGCVRSQAGARYTNMPCIILNAIYMYRNNFSSIK